MKTLWYDGEKIICKSPNGFVGTKEECEVFENDLKEIKTYL